MIGGESLSYAGGSLREQPVFMWKRTSEEGAVSSCPDVIQRAWPIPALTLNLRWYLLLVALGTVLPGYFFLFIDLLSSNMHGLEKEGRYLALNADLGGGCSYVRYARSIWNRGIYSEFLTS